MKKLVEEEKSLLGGARQQPPASLDVQVLDDSADADQQACRKTYPVIVYTGKKRSETASRLVQHIVTGGLYRNNRLN